MLGWKEKYVMKEEEKKVEVGLEMGWDGSLIAGLDDDGSYDKSSVIAGDPPETRQLTPLNQ
jgi:hypothetical protein